MLDVLHHLMPSLEPPSPVAGRNQAFWFPEREISVESFVVGALEAAFHEMVSLLTIISLDLRKDLDLDAERIIDL